MMQEQFPKDLSARIDLASKIVRQAGALALDLRAKGQGIDQKGAQDFVTEADRAIEALIRTHVAEAFPGDGFLGEELGHLPPRETDLTWVVDPIDGTSRYAFGLPEWCISLALCDGTVPVFGLVYAPDLGNTYTAQAGRGSFCNAVSLSVADSADPRLGLFNLEMSGRDLDRFCAITRNIMAGTGGLTRIGSGALALCWVAAGHLSASYDDKSFAWDHLAAALIAKEAGARIRLPRGFADGAVLAASPATWDQAHKIFDMEQLD